MIKAVGTSKKDGSPLVLLGLSGENVTRIMADEPMWIDMADMGLPPMVVVIVGGRTEEAILGQLRAHGLVTEETNIHDRDE